MHDLDICWKTRMGKKREVNEDSALVLRVGDVYVLAIADGLGGHAAGELASRLAIKELEQSLKLDIGKRQPLNAMTMAISRANSAVRLLSNQTLAYRGMASTLVAALVLGGEALIANVGDSRAYLLGNGIAKITKDHSLVQELLDLNMISEYEATGHPQRSLVTMALGTRKEVDPLFQRVRLAGKTLLLCSDGLSDALTDKEIADTFARSATQERACSSLIELAIEKGGTDDITVVLAKGTSYGRDHGDSTRLK